MHEKYCEKLKDFNLKTGQKDNEKCMMCCCHKELKHDNTIKYVLKFKDKLEKNQNEELLNHDQIQELFKKFGEQNFHEDYDHHKNVHYNDLLSWIQNLKTDKSPDEIEKMIEKLSFQDPYGQIDLDNFCIAAENGISIIDKTIFESKRLGKLVEGHSNDRIQKSQYVQVRKDGEY